MLDRLLIALRLKRAKLAPKAMPIYRGHIPPRPMPSPAPWRRSFEPARSEPAPLPVLVDSIAPRPPGADSWERVTEPAAFQAGGGGDAGGAGATGRWEAAPAADSNTSSTDSGGGSPGTD